MNPSDSKDGKSATGHSPGSTGKPEAPKKPAPHKVAVALQYDAAEDNAPRITATGKGKVAEQILNIAFEQGVKVREDADLVQVLGVLEVDSVIPNEVLASVMEILSYVYQANHQMAASVVTPNPETSS